MLDQVNPSRKTGFGKILLCSLCAVFRQHSFLDGELFIFFVGELSMSMVMTQFFSLLERERSCSLIACRRRRICRLCNLVKWKRESSCVTTRSIQKADIPQSYITTSITYLGAILEQ